MAYLTHCKKAFRNKNYEDIVQWENDCKILHLLHLLCYVIVVPSQAQWFTSTSGIIKFECLGHYRRQRMRSVLYPSFYFCDEEHPSTSASRCRKPSGRIYCIMHCMGVRCLKLNAISGPGYSTAFRDSDRSSASILAYF